MSLYHERRFTALGYAAPAILAAWSLLMKLLMDSYTNNLLVQACKLCLESEIFLTELKVLAYFTHQVTLPLLNCIAIGNHNDLLEIFPKLWSDVKSGNVDTITEYLVIYKHVPVQKPNSITRRKAFVTDDQRCC